MANDQKPVISVRKLRKVYMMGQEHVVALHNIDLDIPRGEVSVSYTHLRAHET